MAPKYVLIYFDVRGRGEPTRLLFKAAGVEFEDRRLSFEEWGKAEKEKLKSGESSMTDVLKRPAKVKGRINFPWFKLKAHFNLAFERLLVPLNLLPFEISNVLFSSSNT